MIISHWFSDFALIWIGTNIYWIWKPIVHSQKELIDRLIQKAFQYWNLGIEILDKYIPKYKDSNLKKD